MTQSRVKRIISKQLHINVLRNDLKNYAILNFTGFYKILKKYDKAKSFDHIIIYSPTANNEPKYKHLIDCCNYATIELFEDFSHDNFAELRLKIDKRIEEYKKYERHLRKNVSLSKLKN